MFNIITIILENVLCMYDCKYIDCIEILQLKRKIDKSDNVSRVFIARRTVDSDITCNIAGWGEMTAWSKREAPIAEEPIEDDFDPTAENYTACKYYYNEVIVIVLL